MSVKPCPFCGGNDIVFDHFQYAFQCQECEAIGPYRSPPSEIHGGKPQIAAAKRVWNKRKPAPSGGGK